MSAYADEHCDLCGTQILYGLIECRSSTGRAWLCVGCFDANEAADGALVEELTATAGGQETPRQTVQLTSESGRRQEIMAGEVSVLSS